ncbi:MAG: UvrD-helicase domain-containing protein [Spirochaetes bacterium]|nr:UvrD-helicase domain-containing protein [Spirochaetota bacterium]
MTTGDYLAMLNPEQLAAVRHEGRGLLILAGAGSGKTRVITTKIAWLIRERGLEPESILAVTFTNKAAREMQERACAMEPRCSRTIIRTFHSFGSWFLRRNARAAGLDSSFTIYDDDDSTTLVHGFLPEKTRSECSRIASRIAKAKDFALAPDSPGLAAVTSEGDFRRLYGDYEARLRKTGNVDFGDLILLPGRILAENEAIRNRFRQRFRVVLVDEYQDSNVAQFELLRLLAGDEAYVCVVGDDDQSIYRFRGAEVRNILTFPDTFGGIDVVRLERNYRSYQSILDVAGAVVSRNEGRLGKRLVAERKGGRKPVLATLADHDEEAAYCARVVERVRKAGGSYSDVAVLYRTNAQSLAFERLFARIKFPYRIVGSVRFYEREEIKDALAFLAVVSNGRDEVAFRRVVNKPARGVGGVSVQAIVDEAYFGGTAAGGTADGELPGIFEPGNLVAAARRAAGGLTTARARSGLAAFVDLVDRLGASLGPKPVAGEVDEGAVGDTAALPVPPADPERSLARLVERVVMESGLREYHESGDEVQGKQRAANLDELVNAASDYGLSRDGLAQFLEAVELDRAMTIRDPDADAVTLITIHNTKGLEFPVVIVTGLEQGLFPRDDESGEDLEEERRLFYVACTRAKDELHLTWCRRRLFRGKIMESAPSRFLGEIPREAIDTAGGRLPAPALSTGPWKPGLAVYHDDYGPGCVAQVKPTGSGPLVIVRFETGKQLRFFTRYAGLEIVGR